MVSALVEQQFFRQVQRCRSRNETNWRQDLIVPTVSTFTSHGGPCLRTCFLVQVDDLDRPNTTVPGHGKGKYKSEVKGLKSSPSPSPISSPFPCTLSSTMSSCDHPATNISCPYCRHFPLTGPNMVPVGMSASHAITPGDMRF